MKNAINIQRFAAAADDENNKGMVESSQSICYLTNKKTYIQQPLRKYVSLLVST